MTSKCHACPVAGECRSYPALCDRMARDPARWRPVLDQVNGIIPPEPPPKPVPLAESLRARRLGFNSCWYAVKCNTGCQGPRCHHLKRIVSLRNCIDCLKP